MNLINFDNNIFGQIQIIQSDENFYFNADAIANILGYSETRSMYQIFKNVPKDDLEMYVKHFSFEELSLLHSRDVVEQNQQPTWSPNGKRFLTEAGVFMLLNKSEKPNAYPFQKEINTVILPKIRRDGFYISDNIKNEQLLKLENEVVELKQLLLEKQQIILEKENLIEKQRKAITTLKTNPKYEKTYQAWLNDMVGGQREVRVGNHLKNKRKMKRIDVLTDNHIFECKHVSQWEKAITQVMKYKILMQGDGAYKEQKLNVFLFEESDKFKEDIEFIREVAKESNVSIFYYGNMTGYVDADELYSEEFLEE